MKEMRKSFTSQIKTERMGFKEPTLHTRNGQSSLKKMHGDKNCNDGEVYTSNHNQDLDIDVHIFCNGDVNKEVNKLGVGCIAYDKNCGIFIKAIKTEWSGILQSR